jgi:hypothetical protein
LKAIKIKIIKFITDGQPGFVECIFFDALNKKHIIQDKVPIVTEKYLDAKSEYPQDGLLACKIINERVDSSGNKIITVNTTEPCCVETIDGLTEFNVLEEQLIELEQ